MKLSELANSPLDPPRILFFGPPGSGKTAATLTFGADLELIDLDKGLRSGLSIKDNWTETRGKVEIFPCREANAQKPEAFLKAKNKLMDVCNQVASKTYKYKVLALDSLTELGEAALRYVRANSGTLTNGKNTTLQEWGLAINEVQQCLNMLKTVPIPVVVITHELNETEESGAKRTRMWVIGAKLPDQLGAYFDEIWYARTVPGGGGSVSYTIQTLPTSAVVCRSRMGVPNGTSLSKGLPAILKEVGYSLPTT